MLLSPRKEKGGWIANLRITPAELPFGLALSVPRRTPRRRWKCCVLEHGKRVRYEYDTNRRCCLLLVGHSRKADAMPSSSDTQPQAFKRGCGGTTVRA